MADRVRREVWLEVGLKLLADQGDHALTVQRLCAAVGRSKGSFYHHFTSAESFASALLEHWRETQTERVIREVDVLGDRWVRRAELDRLAAGFDSRLEQAVRRWATSDEKVRALLRSVDDRRMAYLASVIEEVADCDEAEASELARIEYAALVGAQQLYPDLDRASRERLFQKITDLVTPTAGRRCCCSPPP